MNCDVVGYAISDGDLRTINLGRRHYDEYVVEDYYNGKPIEITMISSKDPKVRYKLNIFHKKLDAINYEITEREYKIKQNETSTETLQQELLQYKSMMSFHFGREQKNET